MAVVRTRAYRKLMFAFAVISVIIITYIYRMDIYIGDIGFSTCLHLNILYCPDNSRTSNDRHTIKTQHNANGGDDGLVRVHDDMIVPGQNAWIPYPVKRNPSGPFILRSKSGEAIKYTNYSFYPLTFNSNFFINNPNICNGTETLTFLIMVHTAVQNFERRKALRDTWANPRLLKKYTSRIVFFVGKSKHKALQKALEIESEKFEDIVQGDFIDDYHNLTHKGILGYRWIVTYCENAKFILKVDDDMFVNIFLVIDELLPSFQKEQKMIACRFIRDANIDRDGKYAVDPDYFPGYQRSPLQYCTGGFVLMLNNIVAEMYELAKSIPFYWVDDFYLFGVLPNQILNISFYFVGNVDNNEENAQKCFEGHNPCKYLAAYAWTHGIMYKYWDAALIMYRDLVQKYAMEIQ